MQMTVREIANKALAAIVALDATEIYSSQQALYRDLAKFSQLSTSLIREFHMEMQNNLSTDSLDRLVAAITAVERLHTT